MREISSKEINAVGGGWLPLAFAAARLGWAVYRHATVANAATWAARGAGITGTTYQLAKFLGARKDRD